MFSEYTACNSTITYLTPLYRHAIKAQRNIPYTKHITAPPCSFIPFPVEGTFGQGFFLIGFESVTHCNTFLGI